MNIPALCNRRIKLIFWSVVTSTILVQNPSAADETFPTPQFIGDASGTRSADLKRSIADDVIYDVLVDRFANGDRSNDSGGISGGASKDGFYPQHMEFFHGGDLKGLNGKLDYLQGLGITAIRLSPIMTVQPVQGESGRETGGYHGQWVLDFTRPDPHFGTPNDLKNLISNAHRKGMRIFLTAVVNGTADLIRYRQCHDQQYTQASAGAQCAYRSIAQYPFITTGGLSGNPINKNFNGIEPKYRTVENFARLNDPNFAFTPYLNDTSNTAASLKPTWMNNLRLFNNRGNATQSPESQIHGDVNGQDDLMLAHPRVARGMIDIYKNWIDQYNFDGLHIANVNNMDHSFLASFASAIEAHALSVGIDNFVISASPDVRLTGEQAAYRQQTRIGAITDTAMSDLVFSVIDGSTDVSAFRNFFDQDSLYRTNLQGSAANGANELPIRFSNYNTGRLSGKLRANITSNQNRLMQDIQLAYAAAFFLRGVPVIYYGDEQGFISDSAGPSAQEDMLASKVDSYIDNDLLGTSQNAGVENFDRQHPLYRAISAMATLRAEHQALRTGPQNLLIANDGVLIVSRTGQSGNDYLIAFNFSNNDKIVQLALDPALKRFSPLVGQCQPRPNVAGSYRLNVPDHEVVVCIGSK